MKVKLKWKLLLYIKGKTLISDNFPSQSLKAPCSLLDSAVSVCQQTELMTSAFSDFLYKLVSVLNEMFFVWFLVCLLSVYLSARSGFIHSLASKHLFTWKASGRKKKSNVNELKVHKPSSFA